MSLPPVVSAIQAYVRGEIPLRKLEDNVVPSLSFYASSPLSWDSDLFFTAELGLAEMNAGVLSEDLLRSRLADFIGKGQLSDYGLYPPSSSYAYASCDCRLAVNEVSPPTQDWYAWGGPTPDSYSPTRFIEEKVL